MASIHGHRLDDLGRADQRPLLAVEELRERPVLALDAERDPFLVAPLLDRGAGQVEADAEAAVGLGLLDDQPLLVDLGLPGKVGLAVPLGALGLLVELVELRTGALLVVPGEDGVVLRVHDVAPVGLLGPDHREDGLEVVDLGPSDDVLGAAHLGGHSSSSGVGSGVVSNGVMAIGPSATVPQRLDPGEHEGLHDRRGLGGVGEVDAVGGRDRVGEHDPGGPLGHPPGLRGAIHRARNGAVNREAVASSRSDSSKARCPRTISGSCSAR